MIYDLLAAFSTVTDQNGGQSPTNMVESFYSHSRIRHYDLIEVYI